MRTRLIGNDLHEHMIEVVRERADAGKPFETADQAMQFMREHFPQADIDEIADALEDAANRIEDEAAEMRRYVRQRRPPQQEPL